MKAILATQAGELPDGALVTDPDVMDPYRRDHAETVVPGQPVAGARASSVAGVQAVHPLVSFDRHDPDAEARAAVAFDDEVIEAALGVGGTVSGEHGVGPLESRHLTEQLGLDVPHITKAVKAALDPPGNLNPGMGVYG